MNLLLKLWCDECQRYEWHVQTKENLYRCLGCIEVGRDKHLCIAVGRRVISGHFT